MGVCSFLPKKMQKKLVIIGAGAEQAYAYELAKNNGHFVIATDTDPDAPCLKYADKFLKASTRDAKETLEVIKSYCEESGVIDGVMTIANDVPYTVAFVSNYFNLNGHSVESAKLAHDKFLMKEAFRQSDVPCPEFWSISNFQELEILIESKNLRDFIIKPIDGRGARGVLLLDNQDDLSWAFEESLSWSDSKQLIVERFISGMQISTESYLFKGKAYTPAMSERNYSKLKEFSPYIIEDGGTIPAPISPDAEAKINTLIERGSKAMGVTEGIVKGDIVISEDGEPQIIELALRLSGGWFASNQIIAASGIDLVDIVMKQALNFEITEEMLSPKIKKSTSIRYWFPRPGRIKKIIGEEKIKNQPDCLKYGFFRNEGDIQPPVKMHPDRFGYVIFEGKNRSDSIMKAEEAISNLIIEVEEI